MNNLISEIRKTLDNEKRIVNKEEIKIQELKRLLHAIKYEGLNPFETGYDDIEFGKTLFRILIASHNEKDYSEVYEKTLFLDDLCQNISKENILEINYILTDLSMEDYYLDTNSSNFESIKNELSKYLNNDEILLNNVIKICQEYSLISVAAGFITLSRHQSKNKDKNRKGKDDIDYDFGYTISRFMILDMLKIIIDVRGNEILESCQKHIKNPRKKIKNCEELLKFIEENKDKDEITHIPKWYKKINSEIETLFLKTIYLHNLEYYKRLTSRHKQLTEDTIAKKKQLINEYGISNYSLFDLSMDLETLEINLQNIKELDLTNHPDLAEIIHNSNTERLTDINQKHKSGYLNSNFLKNNIDLFKINDDSHRIMSENLETLVQYKIAKETISRHNKVLLGNPKLIKDNCESISKYGYSEALKNTYSMKFITSENIEEKMDILIELGYSKNIEEDLLILKYDINKYKRLQILKKLGIYNESNDMIKKTMESENFIIPDERLNEYIADLRDYIEIDTQPITKEEFLEKLERNNSSNDSKYYLFNDTIIAREKVISGLNKYETELLDGNSQFEILTKNKPINITEAEIIKQVINDNLKNNNNQKVFKLN